MRMPKVDLESLEQTNATGYPPPFDRQMAGRWQRKIGEAAGFRELGARHVVLQPGAWSSQRHWHDGEDELLVMLTGKAVVVEDEGETEVGPGDVLVWPAGVRNGHHLINRSDAPCSFVCVSAGNNTGGGYSDIDMLFTADNRYTHKDGTPY
jgi:uncharacterized cupin superfamily protein